MFTAKILPRIVRGVLGFFLLPMHPCSSQCNLLSTLLHFNLPAVKYSIDSGLGSSTKTAK